MNLTSTLLHMVTVRVVVAIHFCICFWFSHSAMSETRPWVDHQSFVPEKTDYYFELGAMWEKRNMYWMGGGIGRHLGTCVFSDSQTCQQYWDVFGGVGGRDGLTNVLFLTGPRWQFVNFPDSLSPSVRLFVGVMNIRDDVRDQDSFASGMGLGQSLSVHERVDVRIEGRLGYADALWTQALFSVHVKMDHWVESFADKMKELGREAVQKTGDALKKTGSAIEETFSQ